MACMPTLALGCQCWPATTSQRAWWSDSKVKMEYWDWWVTCTVYCCPNFIGLMDYYAAKLDRGHQFYVQCRSMTVTTIHCMHTMSCIWFHVHSSLSFPLGTFPLWGGGRCWPNQCWWVYLPVGGCDSEGPGGYSVCTWICVLNWLQAKRPWHCFLEDLISQVMSLLPWSEGE